MAGIQSSNKNGQGEGDIWDLRLFTESCKSLKPMKDEKAL